MLYLLFNTDSFFHDKFRKTVCYLMSFILILVWHLTHHLLHAYNLNLLWLSPELLSWIVSYLGERTQRVLFKNNRSYPDHVTSCVSLFLIIDDSCHSRFQSDLDSFYSWCRTNLVNVNSSIASLDILPSLSIVRLLLCLWLYFPV